MSEVTLYDSRGYPLDDPGEKRDETIREMSRYGIVFSVTFGRRRTFAAYFRAYESSSGRLEQYYAVYRASKDEANFSTFRRAVFRTAEERHDLEIEQSGTGENVLNALEESDLRSVGTPDERRRIRRLLSQGQRLRFGVGAYGAAFKLMSDLADAKPGMTFAVTEGDGTRLGSLETYDLVVEKGSYAGLTPLGDTAELMDPTPEDGQSAPETWHDHPAAEPAMTAVAVFAVIVGVVVLYGALVHLAWGGALDPVDERTELPLAEEVPGIHNVSINDAGAPRNFTVSGGTPADNLTLVYVYGNGTTVEEDHINTSASPFDTTRRLPANATGVRVAHPGLWPWPLATWSPEGSAPNETSTQTSTATPQNSPTPTATPQNSPTPTPTPTPTPQNSSAVSSRPPPRGA
ncbi:MAG: hypothetical protein V5A31_05265 [Haloferacaceae archaeon]